MSCVLLLGRENVVEGDGGGNASFITLIGRANWRTH